MTQAPGPHAGGFVHSPGFLALVNAARARVQTLTIEQFNARVAAGEREIDAAQDAQWLGARRVVSRQVGRAEAGSVDGIGGSHQRITSTRAAPPQRFLALCRRVR